jgi:hypothetical protein
MILEVQRGLPESVWICLRPSEDRMSSFFFMILLIASNINKNLILPIANSVLHIINFRLMEYLWLSYDGKNMCKAVKHTHTRKKSCVFIAQTAEY